MLGGHLGERVRECPNWGGVLWKPWVVDVEMLQNPPQSQRLLRAHGESKPRDLTNRCRSELCAWADGTDQEARICLGDYQTRARWSRVLCV